MNIVDCIFHYTLRGDVSTEEAFLILFLTYSSTDPDKKEKVNFSLSGNQPFQSIFKDLEVTSFIYIENFNQSLISTSFSSQNLIYSSSLRKDEIELSDSLKTTIDYWKNFYLNKNVFEKKVIKKYVCWQILSALKANKQSFFEKNKITLVPLIDSFKLELDAKFIFIDNLLSQRESVIAELNKYSGPKGLFSNYLNHIDFKDKIINMSIYDSIIIFNLFKKNKELISCFGL